MNGEEFNNNNTNENGEDISSQGETQGNENIDGQYHFNYEELNRRSENEEQTRWQSEAARYGASENMNGQSRSEEQTRWQPNTEKYNTAYETKVEPDTAKTKKKKKWWIPVVAVAGALTIALAAVVAVLGTRAITRALTEYSENNSGASSIQEIIDQETIYGPIDSVQSNQINDLDSLGSFVLTDVSDVVKEVMPSVVSITSRSLVSTGGYGGFWGFYFGGSSGGQMQEVESGAGSGTIVGQNSTELLILTSYHVVEESSSFYITFVDDSNVEGYLKAADEEKDIAIVAVQLSDIDSSTMNQIKSAKLSTEGFEVGDGVIVIGNALGYGQSVTTGIISAASRTITADGKTVNVFQTDAAINGGNSGGCVLNAKGEIIGISEAKYNSVNVEGVCYAIPIRENYDLIVSLMSGEGSQSIVQEEETTTARPGAYIGIQGMNIDAETAASYGGQEGVIVAVVVPGGGAEAAGLAQGDIIIGIDGKEITTMTELSSYLESVTPGDTVTLNILKYGNTGYTEQTVSVRTTGALQ